MREIDQTTRQALDQITPEVLKGQQSLTAEDEREIILRLKKMAVELFFAGNSQDSDQIKAFIKSEPKLLIWPGNGLIFMQQNCGNGKLDEDHVLIYADSKEVNDWSEFEKNIAAIQERRKHFCDPS